MVAAADLEENGAPVVANFTAVLVLVLTAGGG